MLCETCLSINIDELVVDVTSSRSGPVVRPRGCNHHADFHALVKSANRECELCVVVLDEFNKASQYYKGRESCFHEQIYCGIANENLNIPYLNRGGSALWFYWNLDGFIIHIAQLSLYIKRSLF